MNLFKKLWNWLFLCKHPIYWKGVDACAICGMIAIQFVQSDDEKPCAVIVNGVAISNEKLIKAIDYARKNGVI